MCTASKVPHLDVINIRPSTSAVVQLTYGTSFFCLIYVCTTVNDAIELM
jgi:hypothetical protein